MKDLQVVVLVRFFAESILSEAEGLRITGSVTLRERDDYEENQSH